MAFNFGSLDIEDELHHHFINPQQKVALHNGCYAQLKS